MHGVRRTFSVLLSSALTAGFSSPALAAGPAAPLAGSTAASTRQKEPKTTDYARALLVLNRLAFGPRPGEVEQVEAMGVDRWIDHQLHPGKIDDSALDQRLSEYRAPFMDPATLMHNFPPGNLIRQALNNRIAVPSSEPQRAVWESQMAIVRQRQQLRAQEQMQPPQQSMQDQSMTAHGMQPTNTDPTMPPATDAPTLTESEQKLYADLADTSIVNLPPPQRYQALLHLEPGHIHEMVLSLAARDRPAVLAGFNPVQRETVLALLNPRLVVVNETEEVRLLRDIYSERQLQRVMTEFWLNHFNIFANKDEVEPYYLPAFEREAIAPHALGKFEDLLDAVAQSPAMLVYLDNQDSVGPDSLAALRRERADTMMGMMQAPRAGVARNRARLGINENYGRELMELHTVGVNGGYTQQDVIEAAKVLTGWGVAPPQLGGGFQFNQNRHEPGEKVVLGHRIRGGGQEEGLELLHILATSPATAQFISRELAVRFVSDDPSPALVDHMASTFLSSDGNIAKVLRTMINSRDFWSAPETGNKIKTPLDYVVSAARATNADVTQPYRLVSELKAMGMPLTGTQQPNGYAMTNNAWVSTSELVSRMNFALALASNRIPGVMVSLDPLVGQDGDHAAPAELEDRLEQVILHGPASPAIHLAVLASLNDTAVQTRAAANFAPVADGGGNPFAPGLKRTESQPAEAQETVMAALLIGSPEFQRR